MEILHSHDIFFVCPSLLSRNFHKLESDARPDAVESQGPTRTESPQLKSVIMVNVNIRKSQARFSLETTYQFTLQGGKEAL